MDPNATLEEMRTLAEALIEADDPDPGDVERLAHLVQALDQWITKGGFLPAAWQHGAGLVADLAQARAERADARAELARLQGRPTDAIVTYGLPAAIDLPAALRAVAVQAPERAHAIGESDPERADRLDEIARLAGELAAGE